MQRALIQFFIPKNRPLVREALRLAYRDDLIGFGKNCLVPPESADRPQASVRSGEKGKEKSGKKSVELQRKQKEAPKRNVSRTAKKPGRRG